MLRPGYIHLLPSDYILQTKREIQYAIMCSFFLLFIFFLPDRPTHLHESEGDGKRNILLGWPKGRTIRKVIGAWGGIFSLHEFFFRSLVVQEFFFQVNPSARIFFSDKYCFFLNSEILIHCLYFCAL